MCACLAGLAWPWPGYAWPLCLPASSWPLPFPMPATAVVASSRTRTAALTRPPLLHALVLHVPLLLAAPQHATVAPAYTSALLLVAPPRALPRHVTAAHTTHTCGGSAALAPLPRLNGTAAVQAVSHLCPCARTWCSCGLESCRVLAAKASRATCYAHLFFFSLSVAVVESRQHSYREGLSPINSPCLSSRPQVFSPLEPTLP